MNHSKHCALCLSPGVVLRNSHIIPEFVYRRIYTDKHKMIPIPMNIDERIKPEQKGYREYLLCDACEGKFSRWERQLSLFMTQVVDGLYATCVINKEYGFDVISGFDYHSLKMAVLSIFWRAHVSKNNFFSAYDLGPYGEKFRRILNESIYTEFDVYPVTLSRIVFDGNFSSGFIIPIPRQRHPNGFYIQTMVLNGLCFDCFVCGDGRSPNIIKDIAFKSPGVVKIPDRGFESIGVDVGNLAKMASRDDIRKFYKGS